MGLSPNVASNIKDINKENTTSDKTQALIKSKNKDIWVVGTLHQLKSTVSYTHILKKTK